MSAQKPITVRETQFAYYFLQHLGGNLNNSYLLAAVVAWLRAEVGYNLGSMFNKNNPLNIRDSKLAESYRQTKSNGHFAQFASLKMGAYAAANLLLGAGPSDSRGYWIVVNIAGRPAVAKGKDVSALTNQALDFIEAIALSKWDAGRYGLHKGHRTASTYVVAENSIYKILTGLNVAFPKITLEPDKPKALPKAHVKAHPPKPLPPPSPPNLQYLDPFQAGQFYSASRPSSDLGNLPDF